MAPAAKSLVSNYQRYASSDYNKARESHCMFYPSCSSYMEQAIDQEGLISGLQDGLAHWGRCNGETRESIWKEFLNQTAQGQGHTHLVGPKAPAVMQEVERLSAELKSLVQKHPQGLKENWPAGDAQRREEISQRLGELLLHESHLAKIVRPGQDPSLPGEFVLTPADSNAHTQDLDNKPAAALSWAQKGVLQTVKWAAAAVGCAIGAVPLAVAGAITGALKGGELLATGQSEDIKLLRRSKLYATTQTFLQGTHQKMAEAIGQNATGVIGTVVGSLAGLAAGLAGAVAVGLPVAAKMSGSLAKNWLADKLGWQKAHNPHDHDHEIDQVLQNSAAQPPIEPKKWTMIAHLDATEARLEPVITRHAMQMERVGNSDLHLVSELRRDAHDPAHWKSFSWRHKFLYPIAAAGYAVVSFLGGQHLGPVITNFCLQQVPLVWRGIQGDRNSELAGSFHQEPAWTGTRHYEPVKEVPQPDRWTLQTPATQLSPSPEVADSKTLGQTWAQHFKKYPSQFQAITLSGHGLSYKKVAGMSLDHLEKALTETVATSNKKVDLLVFEACQSANLEALTRLAPVARYAIVSQENMKAMGLPWGHIIEHWNDNDKEAPGQAIDRDPQTLASKWIRRYGADDREILPTLSLIDLEKLPKLHECLENLAQSLDNSTGRKLLKAALQPVRHFPHQSPSEHDGWIGKVEHMLSWLGRRRSEFPAQVDLKELLTQLQSEAKDSPLVQKNLKDCQAALGEAVIISRSSQEQANGLSVLGPSPVFFLRDYKSRTGLNHWGDLVSQLRPMRSRTTTSVIDRAHETLCNIQPKVRQWHVLDRF